VVDGQGGGGNWGLFDSSFNPKPAATFIHNLTAILADNPQGPWTSGALSYSIINEPATAHDMLLQKSNGAYELVVWGESASQLATEVIVVFATSHAIINVYDITVGTTPVSSYTGSNSVALTLTDHAMVVEVID
jgi:hypothetical protein